MGNKISKGGAEEVISLRNDLIRDKKRAFVIEGLKSRSLLAVGEGTLQLHVTWEDEQGISGATP